MSQTTIQNEEQLRKILVGTELPGAPGTAVVPTFQLFGRLMLNRAEPLADYTEYDGSYDADITVIRGPVTVDGTYTQNLCYEDGPILMRYGVKGQPVGVSDAEATPGYVYTLTGSASRDDIDTATVQEGFPGMPFQATMLDFPEFTISADCDDTEAVWKWSSPVVARSMDRIVGAAPQSTTSATSTTITKTAAGWTINQHAGAFVVIRSGVGIGQWREIVSNTATVLTVTPAFITTPDATSVFEISGNFTAGVASRTRERIAAPGTTCTIDDTTIGTTPPTNKLISFSVTNTLNSYRKRFMEDVNSMSRNRGRGKRRITAQLRVEFNDWLEYDKWVASTKRIIRIQQLGSIINASPQTNKTARIDIVNAQWDVVDTQQTRQDNIVATFALRAYKDSSLGYSAQYMFKTAVAALP